MTNLRLYCCFFLMLGCLILSSCSFTPVGESEKKLELICVGGKVLPDDPVSDSHEHDYSAALAGLVGDMYTVRQVGELDSTVNRKGDNPIWKHSSFKELMNSEPDIVVIMMGVDDIKGRAWKFRKFFNGDYTKLVMELKKLESHPRVLVCSLLSQVTVTGDAVVFDRLEELNSQIKVIAHVAGVEFVHLSAALQARMHHLNGDFLRGREGEKMIARIIYDAVMRP